MATTTTDQTRKFGDTLILSGELGREDDGGLYPDDADWVGAVGKINIVTNAETPVVTVDHGTVTITAPSGDTLARYRYQGAAQLVPIGVYRYEIEVTFTNGVILTWPNDGTRFKLKVVPQLA